MPQHLAERPMPGEDRTQGRSGRTVSVNLAESPLGWLRARQLVTDRQFSAGELLRTDFERAQLAPRITMRWDQGPLGKHGHGAPDPAGATVAHLSARRRFDAAIAHA